MCVRFFLWLFFYFPFHQRAWFPVGDDRWTSRDEGRGFFSFFFFTVMDVHSEGFCTVMDMHSEGV